MQLLSELFTSSFLLFIVSGIWSSLLWNHLLSVPPGLSYLWAKWHSTNALHHLQGICGVRLFENSTSVHLYNILHSAEAERHTWKPLQKYENAEHVATIGLIWNGWLIREKKTRNLSYLSYDDSHHCVDLHLSKSTRESKPIQQNALHSMTECLNAIWSIGIGHVCIMSSCMEHCSC